MNQLDNIPKQNPFQVPEGYFDRLPGVIQARVAEKQRVPYARYALRYALPAVLLVVAAFFYLRPAMNQSAEKLLASVDTADLVAYLETSDITTDELLETLELDAVSVDAIEEEVYFNMDITDDDWEILLEEVEHDPSATL